MIVTIGNNKGGVGKTSIACNLAVALGRIGHTVLLVDLDSQCNATSIILGGEGIVRGRTAYDLLDPEQDLAPDTHADFIVPTRHQRVSCLPNIEESSALDIPLGRHIPGSFHLLRERLGILLRQAPFDIVLIDNPPSIGLWLTISLVASDCAIVPIDAASGYSLVGLRKVLDLIGTVSESINPRLRFLRLVVNRADARKLVTRHIVEQIQQEFPDRHFKTIIPANTAVQQAEYLQRTVIEHAPTSRAARAYKALAIEMVELLYPTTQLDRGLETASKSQ